MLAASVEAWLGGSTAMSSVSGDTDGRLASWRANSLSSHRRCWFASAKNSRTVEGLICRIALSNRSTNRLSISSSCTLVGARMSLGYCLRSMLVHRPCSLLAARASSALTIGSGSSSPASATRYRWTDAVVR